MPYFPNASDPRACRFQNECADCSLGEKPCPVALVLLVHNYDQANNEKLEEAMNLLVCEETGECKMKTLMESD